MNEGGATIVTGTVKSGDEACIPSLTEEELTVALKGESKSLSLSTEDIYKELRLQGYEYHGAFKGIKLADSDGKSYETIRKHYNFIIVSLVLNHSDFLLQVNGQGFHGKIIG